MIRYGRGKLLIIGIILLAFGIAILAANRPERAGGIAGELVETSAVSPENEGRLVIVSGTPQLAGGGIIIDAEAGLQVENTVFYSRMPMQKVYVRKSRQVVVDKGEDKISPNDDITETEYYVVLDWIPADTERDAVVNGSYGSYENPPKISLSAFHATGDLRIAGFKISPADVFGYITTKEAGFTQEELGEACGGYIRKSEINLRAVADESGYGMLSSGDEIGDVHVNFTYETLEGADPVTVIGRQRGDQIVFEEDDAVSQSEHIRPGIVSREEFLASITAEDASSRKYGIAGIVLGAVLILLSINWKRKKSA